MQKLIFSTLFFLITGCAWSQGTLVGGRCEGCEAVFEYGDRDLSPVDTLPDFGSQEPRMKVTGTIYKPDGKTPAPDVILYIYHTNREGIYATEGGETGWGRRHGYIRGWIKTGRSGTFTFYTFKPGSYGSNLPHIHATILEPDGKYYWISDYKFTETLSPENLTRPSNLDQKNKRAVGQPYSVRKEGSLLVVKRDIILGLNVPGYE